MYIQAKMIDPLNSKAINVYLKQPNLGITYARGNRTLDLQFQAFIVAQTLAPWPKTILFERRFTSNVPFPLFLLDLSKDVLIASATKISTFWENVFKS
jgi:hypothetical protein